MTESATTGRPVERRGDLLLRIGLVTLAGLMVLSIWLSLVWSQAFDEVRRAGTHRNELSAAAGDVHAVLQEAEIGQHGFLLTGRPADRATFEQARKVLPAALDRLDAAARGDAAVASPAADIRAAAIAAMTELQAVVDLAGVGDTPGAIGRVAARGGEHPIRSVREAIGTLQRRSDLERSAAIEAAQRRQSALHLSLMATSLLSLAGAVAAILVLRRSNRRLRSEIRGRIAATQDLRIAEARNRAFFEFRDDFLFIVERDPSGAWRFVAVNPKAEQLVNRKSADIVGQRVEAVMGLGAGARLRLAFERCNSSGTSLRYEERGDVPPGADPATAPIFDVALMPLTDEDAAIRVIGSARDVTAARQTEMALAQSQKLEAIGQLTGGVAHDFNNVLQVVLGNLELALRNVTDEKAVRRLQAGLAAAGRGQRLVQQLLAFARRQPMQLDVVTPIEVLTDIEGVIRTTVGDRVHLVWRLAPDCWPVRIDRTQLENAVINLVINARDAMPDGGELTVEASNVQLDSATAARMPGGIPGQHVCICVRDTGTGISPELMEKVFQPFFTTKPPGKGTGLGLAMVQGFVRQAGGFPLLESEVGRGTAISLFLPRSQVEATARSDVPDSAAAGETILVVEDEVEVRVGTAEHLRTAGYRVEEAADAAGALARLEDGERVDLLLADIVMPGGVNGLELARRAQAARPDLAVLFMTGHPTDPAVRDAVSGGEALLLTKPFREEQLRRAVRGALDGRDRRAAALEPGSERVDFRPAATGAAVLIVEDDPLVRAVATDALTAAGYRCIETGLAAEALTVLRDRGVLVSLMITDLGLPDMEGRKLLAEARLLRPGLPALICSGYGARDALAALVEPGASRTEVLGKPYSPEMLVRLVEETLKDV